VGDDPTPEVLRLVRACARVRKHTPVAMRENSLLTVARFALRAARRTRCATRGCRSRSCRTRCA
jgi:hypothetical protein